MTAERELCLGCGLCCDGTLFSRGKLAKDEEGAIEAVGGEVSREEGQAHFQQPCRFHCEGRCTIYANRWAACRRFRCALLRRYQAEEISLQEARSTVETALELIASVKANDPAAVFVIERRRLRRELAAQLDAPIADEQHSTARRLLNIIALDTFLERCFRNKKEFKPEAEMQPDTAGQL